MKLRIKDNSLRLRLTVTEVGDVARGHGVSASMVLPEGRRMVYAVQAGGDVRVDLGNDTLTVTLPSESLLDWASGDAVSLNAEIESGSETLTLLVEKDFACLTPRDGNDDSDTFAHPRAGEDHC